jgi:hypothetical protein
MLFGSIPRGHCTSLHVTILHLVSSSAESLLFLRADLAAPELFVEDLEEEEPEPLLSLLLSLLLLLLLLLELMLEPDDVDGDEDDDEEEEESKSLLLSLLLDDEASSFRPQFTVTLKVYAIAFLP